MSFEYGWFYWDDAKGLQAGKGATGRSSHAVISIPVVPDFRGFQFQYFEFVTSDRDTVIFNANVAGDALLGSHLLFEGCDRGAVVLGWIKPSNPPR